MYKILYAAQAFLLLTLHGSCKALTIGARDILQASDQDLLEPTYINYQELKTIVQNLVNVPIPKPIYTPQCDAGYTNVDGHCYRYYSQASGLNKPNYNSVCQTDNPRAFLATPNLSADNDEFGVLIQAYFPTANDFWIGYKANGAFTSPDLAAITMVNSNNAPINVDLNRWRTLDPNTYTHERTLFVSSVGADWEIDIENGATYHSYLCQH